MKVVIVGGVAAGMSAAARLRRLDERAEITVFERGEAVSFANCGLPYYISGVIENRDELLLQTPESLYARFRIDVKIRHEVVRIDAAKSKVEVRDLVSGKVFEQTYDKLVLSPGAEPVRPPILGLSESKRFFTLRNMSDTDAIKTFVTKHKVASAVVIGAGFIGLEMVESLHHLGAKVSLVEALPQVMNVVDAEIAAPVTLALRKNGVEVHLSDSVKQVRDVENGVDLTLASGKVLKADMAILSVGVRPESTLAKMAGLRIGERGGIWVNEFLQTSDPAIYAAGDAIETKNLVTGKYGITPLAGPANKQGRLIADNIVLGNRRKFEGTIGTGIAKVFDLAVGSTGANEKLLRAEGIPFETVLIHPGSHAGYYPGAQTVTLKLLYSPVDGRILGAQAVGREGVDRRLDVLALAVHKGLTVSDLEEYEHVYAPPFSGAKDPVNLAAYVASNVMAERLKTISQSQLAEHQRSGAVLLDVRTPGEVRHGTIPGAMNVPVDELRERLGEVPKDKPLVVFCAVGLRAYVATRVLMQHGFSDVKSLSGGYYTYQQLEKTAMPF
jgi:NADPH-dependent 2,4-dienoyl-CoA reductase/sulfur reductase-like enzyme/rhodanese-related sulfurtransferase